MPDERGLHEVGDLLPAGPVHGVAVDAEVLDRQPVDVLVSTVGRATSGPAHLDVVVPAAPARRRRRRLARFLLRLGVGPRT